VDLELGEHYNVTFTDPDVVKYAESFGANGYRISNVGELLPTPLNHTRQSRVRPSSPAPSTTQRTSVFTDALG
jgi:hypothetical protein